MGRPFGGHLCYGYPLERKLPFSTAKKQSVPAQVTVLCSPVGTTDGELASSQQSPFPEPGGKTCPFLPLHKTFICSLLKRYTEKQAQILGSPNRAVGMLLLWAGGWRGASQAPPMLPPLGILAVRFSLQSSPPPPPCLKRNTGTEVESSRPAHS